MVSRDLAVGGVRVLSLMRGASLVLALSCEMWKSVVLRLSVARELGLGTVLCLQTEVREEAVNNLKEGRTN